MMIVQLNRSRIRKIFHGTTTNTAKTIMLQIVGSLVAMALLLWTIRHGYEAAIETRKLTSYCQWVSRVWAIITLFGFLLMALGLPIIADLFLRLSEELQYPEEPAIQKGSNPKDDVSV